MPVSSVQQALHTEHNIQNSPQDKSGNTEAVANKKGTDLATNSSKPDNIFENFLNRSSKTKAVKVDLKNQLADIKQKGKLIQSHPLPKMVREYVSEVRSFLTDVKDHAFQHRTNDEGLFERMEVIDSKLSELGDQLLDEQKNELEIVANLGELQGLLIDFYV